MLHEMRPALERVQPGENILSVHERSLPLRFVTHQHDDAPGGVLDRPETRDRAREELREIPEPSLRPDVRGVFVGRAPGTEQLLGQLAVLIDIRARRERNSVHDSSFHVRLASALQAERSLVWPADIEEWARPFPRTGGAS